MDKIFLFLLLETALEAAQIDGVHLATSCYLTTSYNLAPKLYTMLYQRLKKYAMIYQINVNNSVQIHEDSR